MNRIHPFVLMITLAGGSAWAAGVRDVKFNERDANRDGVLTRAEFAGHPGNFAAMDCNHDGVLSRSEFDNQYQCGNDQAAKRAAEQRQAERQRDNGRGNTYTPEPGYYAPSHYLRTTTTQRLDARFNALDRNRDGVLSRWELAADQEFRRLDRNGNGVIDRNEFRDGATDDYEYEQSRDRGY